MKETETERRRAGEREKSKKGNQISSNYEFMQMCSFSLQKYLFFILLSTGVEASDRACSNTGCVCVSMLMMRRLWAKVKVYACTVYACALLHTITLYSPFPLFISGEIILMAAPYPVYAPRWHSSWNAAVPLAGSATQLPLGFHARLTSDWEWCQTPTA